MDDPGSQTRSSVARTFGRSRDFLDPFFGTRKSRIVTNSVLLGILAVIIVSNVFGGAPVKANVTDVQILPGKILYTAELDVRIDHPVDVTCYVWFFLRDDVHSLGSFSGELTLHAVSGSVSTPGHLPYRLWGVGRPVGPVVLDRDPDISCTPGS